MRNFEFYNPVKIVFGEGSIAKLKSLVPRDKKVMLTYGGGSIKKNGVYDQVKDALSGYRIIEFGGIEANPEYETLRKAAEICRKEKVGFLLAVGGGSVLDGTKFIAAISNYAGEAWDFLDGKARPSVAIPLGSVMTLPATGSEMNANAVVSRREMKEKRPFNSPLVLPQFAVLDPATTKTLPESQRINGVIDTYVHIMEQYLTTDGGAWVSDNLSEGLLRVLVEHGKDYVEKPDDITVAANIMWASTMALNGIIRLGADSDWSTHGIGHILTAFYGLDHAITLAIVLPGVMQVMRTNKKAKLLQYAKVVWGITEGSEEDRIDTVIQKTEEFFRMLGAKTKLHEFGITEDTPTLVADKMQSIGLLPCGEHRDMDYDTVKEILSLRK